MPKAKLVREIDLEGELDSILGIANKHQQLIDSTLKRMDANLAPVMEKVAITKDVRFLKKVLNGLPKNSAYYWAVNQRLIAVDG